MVLRECQSCQGSDSALLSRSLKNDKTMLLTKWFRTVKLPAHIGERSHPFHNVFAGYNFGKKMPHFFLLAHKDAQPVAFSGVQTQSGLWKAMYGVLEQRYAKSPKRQVKKWLMLLDRYDTLEGRRTSLKEELLAVRSTKGPDSSKAKKLRKKLDETKRMLDEENFRKANLEDQLRRLNDEHSFKMNVLEKQLEEVRSRREIEITEIDSKLIREYEDKLQKALHDLREVYDKQMETNKEELSRIYDDRVRLDCWSILTNFRSFHV